MIIRGGYHHKGSRQGRRCRPHSQNCPSPHYTGIRANNACRRISCRSRSRHNNYCHRQPHPHPHRHHRPEDSCKFCNNTLCPECGRPELQAPRHPHQHHQTPHHAVVPSYPSYGHPSGAFPANGRIAALAVAASTLTRRPPAIIPPAVPPATITIRGAAGHGNPYRSTCNAEPRVTKIEVASIANAVPRVTPSTIAATATTGGRGNTLTPLP